MQIRSSKNSCMGKENRLYSISLGVASLQGGLVGVATALSPATCRPFQVFSPSFFVGLEFIVLAFLAVPFVALAQSTISLETLNAVDIPPDSIVVLNQEETGLPGYIHQKYAFSCLGELRLVDYYGSAFDPKDQDVLEFERTMCSRQKFNDYDTE